MICQAAFRKLGVRLPLILYNKLFLLPGQIADPILYFRPPFEPTCIDVRMAQKCVFVIGITCQMVAFGDDENVGGGIPSPKTTPASQTTTIHDSTWPWGVAGKR